MAFPYWGSENHEMSLAKRPQMNYILVDYKQQKNESCFTHRRSRPLMSQILSVAVMSISLAATMTDGAPPSKQVSGVSRGSHHI